jgi:Trp operon repressor
VVSISTRNKRKSLVKTDIPKIQELLLNDVSQKEIAETFEYSQGTISRLKERLGFAMKKRSIME